MADSNAPKPANGTAGEEGKGTFEQSQVNGTPAPPNSGPSDKRELSNAEKKKLQKAEKAAKRAKDKDVVPSAVSQQGPSTSLPKSQQTQAKDQAGPSSRKRRESIAAPKPAVEKVPIISRSERSKTIKAIAFFSHLQNQSRKRTSEGSVKEVQPAIAQLALQLSSYVICGSHARGVAMLLAFKSLVRSYTTPHGTSLTRHLVSHYLPPQIEHIKAARPLSTTQANSIRWFKNFVAKLDPSAPEDVAKNEICTAIDTFISEKFTVADRVIADTAAGRIRDGDVIVTFGNSAVVRAALLTAVSRGTSFEIVVIDSRPLFEGRRLAETLSAAGIAVQYSLLHAVNPAIRRANKCLLGAHSILANGKVQSRAGAALVAITAARKQLEVIICAETIKFTEKAALDSIVSNELAPEEELLDEQEQAKQSTPTQHMALKSDSHFPNKDQKGKPDKSGPIVDKEPKDEASGPLEGWRERDNLTLLNVMYDVTPSHYIHEVITELGSLPPSSAATVQRLSGDVE